MQIQTNPDWDQVRIEIRQNFRNAFGADNTAGIELFILLQRVAHLSRLLDNQLGEDMELSGPRWRLLLRLFMEEQAGITGGLTPTDLSRSQRVTKNTISSLLRGLESQGLIQRALDANDLRAFRIQLTPAGRDYLRTNAPRRLDAINRMLDVLEPDEYDELTRLLNILHAFLVSQVEDADCPIHPQPAGHAHPQPTEE
ncbi:transcriptional regulator [Longilinea arvoryzae]|uniref:Transcriptional regulator n=1 Tax=Longilinea arvoryzae TaxID=360412 RepID=A0A0K8MY07_9CHLR|nr:MarR family winged helix-turn-helix transcriptional regulator [Longilinea arvoryzae]GAP16139.1 transcriptional regulator [Longilinea arvoryzae]